MKKILMAMCLVLGVYNTLLAHEKVPMQIIKETGLGGENTLAPARPWYITQEGNVLTLPALADDYTLELRDENGMVVYSTFLPTGTTTVVLPSTLSGEFELRLVADTYYYRGYIEL